MARKKVDRFQMKLPVIGQLLGEEGSSELPPERRPKRRQVKRPFESLPLFVRRWITGRRGIYLNGNITASCGCQLEARNGLLFPVYTCSSHRGQGWPRSFEFDPNLYPTLQLPEGVRWVDTIGKPKPFKHGREGEWYILKCGCVIRAVRPVDQDLTPGLRCEQIASCQSDGCDWECRRKQLTPTTTPPASGAATVLECGCSWDPYTGRIVRANVLCAAHRGLV